MLLHRSWVGMALCRLPTTLPCCSPAAVAEDAGFGGGLVGGLLGRAVGGVLRSAAGALAEQLQQAAQQVADVQDRAARVIEGSAKVRAALGGSVRVGPPMSQSSMSQSINGRVSKTVTLLMPVAGANGQTAQVGAGSGASKAGAGAWPLQRCIVALLRCLHCLSEVSHTRPMQAHPPAFPLHQCRRRRCGMWRAWAAPRSSWP